MRSVLAGAVLVAFSGSVSADFMMGSKLKEFMGQWETAGRQDSPANAAGFGFFNGYVAGVYDSYAGVFICAPKDFTVSQAGTIVANYIKAHPEKSNQAASALVLNALREAHPCSRRKGQEK